VNFGGDLNFSPVSQPLLAPSAGTNWRVLWSSNQLEYGGPGTVPLETQNGWHIPGESATVLHAIPKTNGIK
jgi:maltooligosyltrehalose trehalohydrolase